MHPETTWVKFRREDSNLFNDEVVLLNCHDHDALVEKLYRVLRVHLPTGPAIPVEEPPPSGSPTLYEKDCQRVSSRLRHVRWETLDLDTTAFLFGYGGCLGGDGIAAMLPGAFEIMLRSNTYFQVFEHYLHEFKWNGPCNVPDIFNDRNAKSAIETALLTLRDKFLNATSSPDMYLDRYYVEELFSDVTEWSHISSWD